MLLPVALLPDLALGVGHRLEPADYPAAYDEARDLAGADRDGDVLVLPLSSYRAPDWNHRHLVLDPIGRYLTPDYVASDVLVVDGVPLSGEDPRVPRGRRWPWPSPPRRSGLRRWAGSGSARWSPTRPHRVTRRPRSRASCSSTIPTLRVAALDEVDVRDVQTSWLARDGGRLAGFPGPAALALLAVVRSLLTRTVARLPRPAATPSDWRVALAIPRRVGCAPDSGRGP